MKYIKLFENFDNKKYIEKSIRDILIELEDEGMQVKIEYRAESFKYERPSYVLQEPKKVFIQPFIIIEICGKPVKNYPEIYKEFEVSLVRDYIDTVIDFIETIWPNHSLHFEKYDIDDAHIEDGKELKDGKCGSIIMEIFKK